MRDVHHGLLGCTRDDRDTIAARCKAHDDEERLDVQLIRFIQHVKGLDRNRGDLLHNPAVFIHQCVIDR